MVVGFVDFDFGGLLWLALILVFGFGVGLLFELDVWLLFLLKFGRVDEGWFNIFILVF